MVSWCLKKRGLRPIGLDIGHSSIKMIQLLIENGRTSVIAADETRFETKTNGDERARRSTIVSAIKRMIAKGNFHGKDVISCLPSGKLKITSIRLAESDTESIERSLRKEAAQRFGLDPEKDAMDYLVAGCVRQGDEVKKHPSAHTDLACNECHTAHRLIPNCMDCHEKNQVSNDCLACHF